MTAMSDISVLPDQGQSTTFAYRVDYRPAFALASLTLAAEQPIKAQAGAMVSMAGNVELASKMEGGLWGAVKRSVGGRSAFVSTYTAHGGPGELTLAPAAPGDIVPLSLTGEAYNIAASSYLASDATLEVDTGWGGAKSFFASDSLFVLQVRGSGVQFVTSFGALHSRTSPPANAIWSTLDIWSRGTHRWRTRFARPRAACSDRSPRARRSLPNSPARARYCCRPAICTRSRTRSNRSCPSRRTRRATT